MLRKTLPASTSLYLEWLGIRQLFLGSVLKYWWWHQTLLSYVLNMFTLLLWEVVSGSRGRDPQGPGLPGGGEAWLEQLVRNARSSKSRRGCRFTAMYTVVRKWGTRRRQFIYFKTVPILSKLNAKQEAKEKKALVQFLLAFIFQLFFFFGLFSVIGTLLFFLNKVIFLMTLYFKFLP